MVLGGFAEKANFPKITEVLGILKTDNIKYNPQSYAAIFECLGRLDANDENLKLLTKFRDDASKNVIHLFWGTNGTVLSMVFFVGHLIE